MTIEITRQKPRNFEEKDNNIFEHEYKLVLDEVNPVRLKNIWVFQENAIYKNLRKVKNINTKHNRETGFFLKAFLTRKRVTIPSGIWLTDAWSTNYFHWFTDSLPRLLIAEKKYPEIPVLIPANFDRFEYIVESLKVFKSTKINWIRKFQRIKIKELIYIPHTAPTGNYNENLIIELSFRFRKHFGLDSIEPNNKIFISRQAAKNRRIINYSELDEILKKNTISIIAYEELTWIDQVKITAQSKALIGVHGAGLTNMIFMPPDSKILEFRKRDDTKNNCYYSLASALSLDYYYQLCDVDDINKNTQENDFFVETERLEEVLPRVIDK